MYAIGVFFLVDVFYENKKLKVTKKKKVGMRGRQFTRLTHSKGTRIGPPHFPVL